MDFDALAQLNEPEHAWALGSVVAVLSPGMTRSDWMLCVSAGLLEETYACKNLTGVTASAQGA